MSEERAAARRAQRASVPPHVYVQGLRRQVATTRSRLAAAEAEIERVKSETIERVAELVARRDEARERAALAEATLAEAEAA